MDDDDHSPTAVELFGGFALTVEELEAFITYVNASSADTSRTHVLRKWLRKNNFDIQLKASSITRLDDTNDMGAFRTIIILTSGWRELDNLDITDKGIQPRDISSAPDSKVPTIKKLLQVKPGESCDASLTVLMDRMAYLDWNSPEDDIERMINLVAQVFDKQPRELEFTFLCDVTTLHNLECDRDTRAQLRRKIFELEEAQKKNT